MVRGVADICPSAELGYQNVHVGLQRRNRPDYLLGLAPGDAPSATWTVDCTAEVSSGSIDLKGPYIQGPRVVGSSTCRGEQLTATASRYFVEPNSGSTRSHLTSCTTPSISACWSDASASRIGVEIRFVPLCGLRQSNGGLRLTDAETGRNLLAACNL
jgi:hypothetical protein